MAQYDKETKFYWLQLKEDFFENDAIEWLEEQEPNGRDYAYFYLKLCLKSLKSNGILIRNVGNILIPYDNRKLAELTKMDFDTVCVAMKLLQEIGLIEILENGEIYITQLENLIGSKSLGALKKQQQRLISGQKGDKCPPKIEIELKDRVKDKNIDRFKKPTLEEIETYCKERNNNIDAKKFYDYYETGKWKDKDGKPVKNWKQKIITWEGRKTNNYKSQVNELTPDWFDKELKNEKMTEEDINEMDRLLEIIGEDIKKI